MDFSPRAAAGIGLGFLALLVGIVSSAGAIGLVQSPAIMPGRLATTIVVFAMLIVAAMLLRNR